MSKIVIQGCTGEALKQWALETPPPLANKLRRKNSSAAASARFAAYLHRQDRPIRDELELYLASADQQRTLEFRTLEWWTEPAQQKRFPRLGMLAWDLLTVPLTTAEIERTFPECALSLSDRRLDVIPETLEESMLHRSWELYVARGGRI